MMVRGFSLLAGIAAIAFALAEGCSGDVAPFDNDDDGTTTPSGDEPCTDPSKCCSPDELVCVGDADENVVCSCRNLWDCDKNKEKCAQPIVPPDGSGGWECNTWDEFTGVTCEKEGTESDVPDGGGQYTCVYNQEMKKVICKENEPTSPTGPSGAGDWICEPTAPEEGPQKLICEAKEKTDTEEPQLGGEGDWTCADGVCTRTDGGLPPGGVGDWTCHEETIGGEKYLVCTGTSPDNPGGDGEWVCQKLPNEFDQWICKRPLTNADRPDGEGYWSCQAGSEFGGIQCTEVDLPPTAPTPYPTGDDVCIPGTMRWCDGLQFCGWGTVTCLPDGSWPTKIVNGKKMLDCQERADGKRPDTTCACYHFYFNPKCCERPDCIIPAGTDGQICPASDGETCDYCNPQKPECKNGICAVSNSMETFCTVHCGSGDSCPNGMICMTVQSGGQQSKECIPADFSCYNGL